MPPSSLPDMYITVTLTLTKLRILSPLMTLPPTISGRLHPIAVARSIDIGKQTLVWNDQQNRTF
jgi:hypothetical protein